MPDEIPLATSIAGSTKWLTATTVSLAEILGTTYLAGIGADTVAMDGAIVIGAQHVPTAKLHAQFVPGSWMTMGRIVGPLLHMGHRNRSESS